MVANRRGEEEGAMMQTRQVAARSLKEKQRQEREMLILKVAEEVLMEKGYYESSIDEIAGRVGVAKGTVYLHFPSKEDMVLAIFARDMQDFVQSIRAVIALRNTAQEKLFALLEYL
jgi:AcrR family transcriptional regulator